MTSPFRVLITKRENGTFVAQVLEKYFAVQAPSMAQLEQRFWSTISAYANLDRIDGREPLSSLKSAPADVWAKFENAAPVEVTAPKNIDAVFRQVA